QGVGHRFLHCRLPAAGGGETSARATGAIRPAAKSETIRFSAPGGNAGRSGGTPEVTRGAGDSRPPSCLPRGGEARPAETPSPAPAVPHPPREPVAIDGELPAAAGAPVLRAQLHRYPVVDDRRVQARARLPDVGEAAGVEAGVLAELGQPLDALPRVAAPVEE